MQNKTLYSLAAITLIFIGCSSEAASKSGSQSEPDQQVTSAETDLTQTAANCSDPEFRQLDFWVGEWDLTWDQRDGNIGQGTNIIVKNEFGDCVITENFDGAPSQHFKGMSVSTYSKPAKMWRQAWVDDQGGFYSLYGGPQENGTFKLDMERINNQGPFRRMIWKNISEDSLDWHWQGKADEGAEWTDAWVIHYKRK
ncbi:MAG: hypothetical protein HKN36_12010 [Hellea sp.]|nr:hypothetical protein [Hellea sp.]